MLQSRFDRFPKGPTGVRVRLTRNTIACSNGDKMGFELFSPDAWAERVADGRYELVAG